MRARFVATGPLATLALPWVIALDTRSRLDTRQPPAELPGRTFALLLYLHIVIQLLNIALMLRLVAHAGAWSRASYRSLT